MKLTFERDSLKDDLVLMHKDKKLLIFNLKENSFDVLDHTLLPFRLQSSGSMMMDLIVERMKMKEGVTEELKAKDQMKWVGRMNNIRARAEEMVVRITVVKLD